MLPLTTTTSPSSSSPLFSTTSTTSPTTSPHSTLSKHYPTPFHNTRRGQKSPLTVVPLLYVILLFLLAYIQQYGMMDYYLEADQSGWPLHVEAGWFFGRKMDLSDRQWRSFRKFLPLLAVACVGYSLLSNLLRKFSHVSRKVFYLLSSALFILFLFQANAAYILLISLINFCVVHFLKRYKISILITWMFTFFILVTSDYYDGYKQISLFTMQSFFGGAGRFWFLRHKGLIDWSVYFNICMCRLISFNMDYRNAFLKNVTFEPSTTLLSSQSANAKNSNVSEYRKRHEESRALEDYSLFNYLIYVFYVPCFIAGPICSFNAFHSFVNRPQQEVPKTKLARMIVQLIIYVILLEISLHFGLYVGFVDHSCWRMDGVNACSQIMQMNSLQMATTGILTLSYMFLKFTIIWRFFRIWALLDGVNVPENMTDCIFNNWAVSHFWRNWHRSMYLWILTYIYIPLGGKNRKLVTAWLIFTFIALWHDLWWRWIAWAYFNAFLMCIELMAVHFFKDIVTQSLSTRNYRLFIAFVATLNGPLLISANLAIMYGFEGTWHFLTSLTLYGEYHLVTMALGWSIFFVGTLAIFEIKDWRQGAASAYSNTNKQS